MEIYSGLMGFYSDLMGFYSDLMGYEWDYNGVWIFTGWWFGYLNHDGDLLGFL